jgi:hypothetical protein
MSNNRESRSFSLPVKSRCHPSLAKITLIVLDLCIRPLTTNLVSHHITSVSIYINFIATIHALPLAGCLILFSCFYILCACLLISSPLLPLTSHLLLSSFLLFGFGTSYLPFNLPYPLLLSSLPLSRLVHQFLVLFTFCPVAYLRI